MIQVEKHDALRKGGCMNNCFNYTGNPYWRVFVIRIGATEIRLCNKC